MRKIILYSIFSLFVLTTIAQSHWESIIIAGDSWKYFPATSAPAPNWQTADFEDASWNQGIGGFGYEDGDDATVIKASNSVYLRKTFYINNISLFEQLLLDIDYDDAFVCYLNGKEIARSANIKANPPSYNSSLTNDHEALLYRNLEPERYKLNISDLKEGENILAVQVLNNGIGSSDLSALVFLQARINSSSILFHQTPSWFKEPFDFVSSNLPLIIIQTEIDPSTGKPIEIKDDPRVKGFMKILFRPDSTRNYLTDMDSVPFIDYSGRIEIEFRGSSSQDLPKKPYGLTTLSADNINPLNVSLLGMPKENDWILNSIAYDPSLMRNFISYELARKMGNYATRTRYCELVVNGDYKGLYILMEKIKDDGDRVNIRKMLPTDIKTPYVTGGYITKSDKTTGNDPVAWSMFNYNGWNINFIHDTPSPEDIMYAQHNYIYNQFVQLETLARQQNSHYLNGFPSIIDIPSFVDFMLICEISSNADAYHYSTYYHKDMNGKLRAGPIWDFDLTYGNDLFVYGLDRSKYYVWQFDDNDNTGPKYWKDLFSNPTFKCYLSKRWKELTATGQVLSLNAIFSRLDAIKTMIAEAKGREQQRWGTVSTHDANITAMKSWLQSRYNWLNQQFSNTSLCENVAVPSLVISKINYHPATTGYYESDSLEFIEITNTGNSSVDLSGYYFREPGMVYSFPLNSKIDAQQRIFIASNSKAFQDTYQIIPFGQFTRNLSNKSHRLLLCDAFGNTIDEVSYKDDAPWEILADGLGYFLELKDLQSNNNIAENWKASDIISGLSNESIFAALKIYPSDDNQTLQTDGLLMPFNRFEITDITGRIVLSANEYQNSINIQHLPANMYIIRLYFEDGKTINRKFILY